MILLLHGSLRSSFESRSISSIKLYSIDIYTLLKPTRVLWASITALLLAWLQVLRQRYSTKGVQQEDSFDFAQLASLCACKTWEPSALAKILAENL